MADTSSSHSQYMMTMGFLINDLMKEAGSEDFLKDIIACIMFCQKKTTDEIASSFKTIYTTSPYETLNASRRRVDCFYHRIRVLRQLDILSDEAVRCIVEPGSVKTFNSTVLIMSKAKPGARSDMNKQEEFWKNYE